MPIITTYVCDVTGFSSTKKEDFAEVEITGRYWEDGKQQYKTQLRKVEKLVKKEVAIKLGLAMPNARMAEAEKAEAEAAVASVTFEGQLKALLKDWVADIAQEVVDNA
jgi:hypothetical protein